MKTSNVKQSSRGGRSRKGNAQKPKKAHSRRSCYGTNDSALSNTANCRRSRDNNRCVIKQKHSGIDMLADMRRAKSRAKYVSRRGSKPADLELLPNPGQEGGNPGPSASQVRAAAAERGHYQRTDCLDAPNEDICVADPNCQWTKESKSGVAAHCGAKLGVRSGDRLFQGPMLPYHYANQTEEERAELARKHGWDKAQGGNPGPSAAQVRAAAAERGHYQRTDCLDAPNEDICVADPNCQWTKESKSGVAAHCGAKLGVRSGDRLFQGPMLPYHYANQTEEERAELARKHGWDQ